MINNRLFRHRHVLCMSHADIELTGRLSIVVQGDALYREEDPSKDVKKVCGSKMRVLDSSQLFIRFLMVSRLQLE